MEHLSLHRLCGGGLRGSSFTVDPGRYAKKVSGYGHLSAWGSPFHPRGSWYVEGGARVPGTFIDE